MSERRRPAFWQRLVWNLVFPRRRDRAEPTASGLVLFALAMGTGTAAYNSANNILFITLSLLLSSLILSGLLSWLNLRRMKFELKVLTPCRAGQKATAEVHVRNGRSLLPAHGLWFQLKATPVLAESASSAEPVPAPRSLSLKKRLHSVDAREQHGSVLLGAGLGPGEERRLEWQWEPSSRGLWRVELEGVGSQYPFGFLRKQLGLDSFEELLVWPASVSYERMSQTSSLVPLTGQRAKRLGQSSDLLALRAYHAGDSHRLIHWKASARHRHLLVRQFSAEADESFSLLFSPEASLWDSEERFELAVRLACTLAEDLFRAGKLRAVGIAPEAPYPVRRVADLEAWLDAMAVVSRTALVCPDPDSGEAQPWRAHSARQLVTLAPQGPRGAVARAHQGILAVA